MNTPSPAERAALLELCRRLLAKPTPCELEYGEEEARHHAELLELCRHLPTKPIADNELAAQQRAFLRELLATGDPNALSSQPPPAHWPDVAGEETAGVSALFLLADRTLKLPTYRASAIAKFLLRAGATPLAASTTDGRSPLHHEFPNLHITKRLLAAGADPNGRDHAGRTPLFVTCNRAAMKLLHAHGADARARDAQGNTVLHRRLYLCWAQPLVELGADVNAQNARGQTPLFFAGDTKTARYLVEQGANPTHRDKQGRTALFTCALETEHVCFLIEQGCDPNAVDKDGNTPLHVTAAATTVEDLIAHGANVNARNHAGETPLDLACSKRVRNALLSHGAVRGKTHPRKGEEA